MKQLAGNVCAKTEFPCDGYRLHQHAQSAEAQHDSANHKSCSGIFDYTQTAAADGQLRQPGKDNLRFI